MKTSQLHEYAATAAHGLPIDADDAGNFTKSLTLAAILIAGAVETCAWSDDAVTEGARLLDCLQSLRAACRLCLTPEDAARITGIAREAAAEFMACLSKNA